jgi:hypothetical protein
MANSDKNIRITPNRDTTSLPRIAFTGSTNAPITLYVLDDNTLSFEGSSGQLFSVNNNLSSGYIFSINDISGIPSFRVHADGTVGLAEFSGNVGIGITNPSYKLHIAGQAYASGGFVGNLTGTATSAQVIQTTTDTSSTLYLLGSRSSTGFAGTSVFVDSNVSVTGNTITATTFSGNATTSTSAGTAGTATNAGSAGTSVSAGTAGTATNAGSAGTSVTAGSAGTAVNAGLAGTATVAGSVTLTSDSASASRYLTFASATSGSTNVLTNSNLSYNPGAGQVLINSSTASTSTNTGALVVSGGVGIGGSLYTSSSSADSISGIVLNNGVVTSGTWAGSTITSRYGGTGYSTYSKGDLLVAAGTALTKVAVGNDLTILTADSNAGSGVSWKGLLTPTYGAFGSTQTQAVIAADTITYVSFNTTFYANNTSIGSGTTNRVYIYDSGIFDIQFSSQLSLSTGSVPQIVDMWFVVDGVPVPRSATRQTVTGKDFESVLTVNLVQPFISGQYIQLAYSSPDQHLQLAAFSNLTSPTRPDIPSMFLTIEPISSILPGSGLAITGLASLNLLTSNAQTMVTGTSGVDFGISSIGSIHTFNIPDASTTARGLITTGSQTLLGSKTFASGVAITAATASTSTNTGALVVTGGVGIGGKLVYNSAQFGTTGIASPPTMAFIGSTGNPINLRVLDDNTISFSGTQGQLFSISPILNTGWIFSVNDISGIPLIRANADATIAMAEFAGNVGIGLSQPAYKLHVSGQAYASSGFVGNLTGTATSAQVIQTTTDTTSTLYLLGTRSSTGFAGTSVYVDSGISALGNTITATTFSGNATTATSAGAAGTAVNAGSAGTSVSAGTAGTATNAGSAGTSVSAGTAGTATNAGSAGTSVTAGSATTATSAGTAGTATNAGSAGTAFNAGTAGTATNAGRAEAIRTQALTGTNYLALFNSDSASTTQSLFVGSGISVTATSLVVPDDTRLGNNTNSNNTTTGALVVSGGAGITGNLNVGGNLTLTGDLTVNGTTTTVNSTVSTIVDPIITIGTSTGGTVPNSADSKDRGVAFYYFSGTGKTGFFGWDQSASKYAFYTDASISGEVVSGTKATIFADLDGNAGSATTSTSAGTAGTATNAGSAGTSVTAGSAGTAVNAGFAGAATTATSAGTAGTATNAGSAGTSITAGSATTATNAGFAGAATTATSAGTAGTATNAGSAGTSVTAGSATTATNAGFAGAATTSTSAGTAGTATNAGSAGTSVTAGSAGTAVNAGNAGTATVAGSVTISSDSTNASRYLSFTSATSGSSNILTNANLFYNPSAGQLVVNSSTASTSVNTGALVVNGGVGVSGRLVFNQAQIGTTGIATIPSMAFIGQTGNPIFLNVLEDNSLSFDGAQGQLFSITPVLNTGWIFSVNDISGIPLIRANADATISMAQFAGNVGIGLSNPSYKLHVVGDINASTGYTYRINGTKVLDAISLGTSVVSSSLTSVGTLTSGTWNASTIGLLYGGTGQVSYTDGQLLIGSSTGNSLIKSTLTAGSGILITNGSGAITISTTGAGITNLNGVAASYQSLAVGSSGTDFAIVSTGSSHTFNIPDASATNRGLITTGTQTIAGTKTFSSTITGSITGSAGSATTATTAGASGQWIAPITFSLGGDLSGSVTFSGSGNTTLTATIGANSVALGTDTTGNYAGSVSASGTGISIIGSAGEGTDFTVVSNATATNTVSTIVSRDSSGNFSAGTITATTFSGNATTATSAGTAGTATNAGSAGTSVSAGTAGTATNAGSAGTSVSAGTAGTATNAGSAGTSVTAGSAGTATNSANTNVVLDTTSTIYITGSRSNASIGSTPVYVLSGVSALGNTVTATTFSGNATTATTAGSAGTAVNAGSAGSATTATNAGSAGTSVSAGTAGTATNAGSAGTSVSAGTAGTATNAGTAGTATNAGSAGTSVTAGSAGTATNAANVNVVLDTTSTIYLSGSRSNASIGSTPVYILSGVSALGNTLTATTFSGNATTATTAGAAGTAVNAGSAGTSVSAGTAGTATNAGSAGSATTATNAGSAGTSVTAGSAGTAVNAGSATTATNSGTAGTATNAGTAGTATNAGSAGTSVTAGSAGTANNSANTNVVLDTATTIYLTGSRSNASIGATPVYVLSGVSALGNTITATTFSGNATTATTAGSAGTAVNAGNAGSATTATSAGTAGTATNAGSAGTSVTAGSAGTAVNSGSAGSATTAISAGTAGTATNAGSAGTSVTAGSAGTATNSANTNVVLDTTSTIYLTGSRSNASIASTAVYVLSGVSALGNTITATTFSGNATTATTAGSAGTAVNAGSAGSATTATNAGSAGTSVTAGSAGTAVNAGSAGSATTATNAGSAGTSVTAGSAGTSVNAGSAGSATTATTAGSAGTAVNAGSAGTATNSGRSEAIRTQSLTGVNYLVLSSLDTAANSQSLFVGSGISVTGTTLVIPDDTRLGNNTNSSNTSSGALIVSGGVGITGNLNVGGNFVLTGDLTVNGTTTTVNSTVSNILDPIITIGTAIGGTVPNSADSKDRGVAFYYFSGTGKTGFFGWDQSASKYALYTDASISGEIVSGTKGTLFADLDGNAGSATTATSAGTAGTATNAGSAGTSITAGSAGTAINSGSAGSATTANNAGFAGAATTATSAGTAGTATNAGSAGTSVTAGSATTATNAGSAGSATTATNAGFAGAATTANSAGTAGTATNAGSAGTSVTAGSAGTAVNAGSATTATSAGTAGTSTNSANTNIVLDTTSTIYLTGSRSNTSIGATGVYVLSGVSALGNTVTATTFSGNATTATSAGSAGTAVNAGSATTATNAGFAGAATTATSAGTAGTSTTSGSAGSATTATSAGTAGTATNAGSAGSATTATNAGFAGAATTATNAGNAGSATTATNAGTAGTATNAGTAGTATNAGSAGTSVTAGSAGSATTATNAGTAGTATNAGSAATSTNTANTNITLDTTSTIYLTGSRSNISIGSTAVYVLSGVSALGNTITATTFSGNATTATSAGTAGTATNAGSSGSATTATNAGFAGAATTATSAGTAGTATNAGSAGSATTATNAGSAGTSVTSGSSGSATTATSAGTAGTAINAGFAGAATTATNAGNAGSATTATNAGTAGTATNAGSAGTAVNAGSATTATNAGSAGTAVNAGSAGSATTATSAGTAGTATNAGSAGTATNAANTNVVLDDTSTIYLTGSRSNTSIGSTPSYVLSGVSALGNTLSTSGVRITGSTASSNPTTGALVVTGGVGIGGTLHVGPYPLSGSGIGDVVAGFAGSSTNASLVLQNREPNFSTTQFILGNGLNNTGTIRFTGNNGIGSSNELQIISSSGNIEYSARASSGVHKFGVGFAGGIITLRLSSVGATFYNTDGSTSTTTGAIVSAGGVGIAKTSYFGETVFIQGTTASTGFSTGALTIHGGLGVSGNINTSGLIKTNNTSGAALNIADRVTVSTTGGFENLNVNSNYSFAFNVQDTANNNRFTIDVQNNRTNFSGNSAAHEIRFYHSNQSSYTGFKANSSGTVTYTWPAGDGTNGQVLYTNGSAALGWTTPSGSAAGSSTHLQFNQGGAFGATSSLTYVPSTQLLSTPNLALTNSQANEGGEITFSIPSSGTALTTTITMDIYQNRLRIFESGGANRGAYIDFTSCSNSVGTNLLVGSGASGLTSLNGLTASTQTFAVGTSGSDFNISSTTSTHTFNIPYAGAASTGLITTNAQTIAGTKTFSSTISGSITGNAGSATTATSAGTAGTANNAGFAGAATTATSAGTAGTATNAGSAGTSVTAGSATTATNSGFAGAATTATSAGTAGTSTNAGSAGTSVTAGSAGTASNTAAINVVLDTTSTIYLTGSRSNTSIGSTTSYVLSGVSALGNTLSASGINISGSTGSATTATGALVVTGGVGIGGTLNVGPRNLSFSAANLLAGFASSINSYNQVVVQNLSPQSAASADYIVANDVSTDSTFYGSMGMNSSGFTGAGSLNLPSAIYFSATSGDLVLGSTTANILRFVYNSGATDSMQITGTAVTVLYTTASTSSSTGALIVAGGVGIGGSLWTAAANLSSISGVTHLNGAILSGAWAGTAISAVNGGTGQNTYATGDILYASSTTALSRLAAGSAGSVLYHSGTAPYWSSAPTGSGGGAGTVAVGSSARMAYYPGTGSSVKDATGFEYSTSGTTNTVRVFGGSAIGNTFFIVNGIGTSQIRVGIGVTNPAYELEIEGEISATNKSFVINHPLKPDWKLRYGSLEGPENGVYVRGVLKDEYVIETPDYWTGLVDPNSFTVTLTPIGKSDSILYVEKIEDYKVFVNDFNNNSINCFFTVWAERIDIPKLVVEYENGTIL